MYNKYLNSLAVNSDTFFTIKVTLYHYGLENMTVSSKVIQRFGWLHSWSSPFHDTFTVLDTLQWQLGWHASNLFSLLQWHVKSSALLCNTIGFVEVSLETNPPAAVYQDPLHKLSSYKINWCWGRTEKVREERAWKLDCIMVMVEAVINGREVVTEPKKRRLKNQV